MSFVTAVRDYVDFINQSYYSMSTHEGLLFLFHHTFLYLFESIKYALFYLFTFRWMADLLALPTLIPPMSVSILRENFYPLDNPLLNAFRLLEAPSFLHNKFFIGLLNSFFVSLPISAIHLLAGRRLLVEGIPAGVSAGLGTIVGQSFFLASILFGWRWAIIPWLSLEPLNYLVGLLLMLQMIYTICHAPSIKIVPSWDKVTLLKFFSINLLLTWCEQSSLFQYVGNLTLTSEPSYVENFFATSRLSSLGTHALYLTGFVLGSGCFSLLFALLGLRVKEWWLRWSTMTTSRLVNRLNFWFLVGVTALSLASIPYYGLDYLFTRGVGFIPQDKALQGSLFSPAGMSDISHCVGGSSNYTSLDTDATPFDGGRYLQSSSPQPQTFEDLNYQGEQYCTGRMDRKSFSTGGGRKGKAFGRWANLFGGDSRKKVELVVERKPIQRRQFSATDDPLPWYREGEERNVGAPLTDEEEEAGSLSDLETSEIGLEEEKRFGDPPSDLNGDDSEEEKKDGDEQVEDIPFDDFFNVVDAGFSPLFVSDMPEPTNLERYLKHKFYENPVFHLLLKVDIDAFLARQPASHWLTSEEEIDLFRRRQLLADYYDSIQDYMELQEDEREDELEDGMSSYADQVYNHQFKGTLKVVRRLFSITLDPEKGGPDEGRRLFLRKASPFEGGEAKASSFGESKAEAEEEGRVLKFDQPLFHSLRGDQHPLVHEELAEQGIDLSPFIEMTNPRPFYAGWDEQLRRLVITTRYLPRSFSTHGMRIPDQERCGQGCKEYLPLTRRLDFSPRKGRDSRPHSTKGGENPLFTSSRKLLFTAWPVADIPKRMTELAPTNSTSPGSDVDEKVVERPRLEQFASAVDGKVVERVEQFTHPDGEYHDWEIESWPENMAAEWTDRHIIPPNRGGFVWPGSSAFPFDVKKFIPNVKPFFHW